jgi:hypothetical protein
MPEENTVRWEEGAVGNRSATATGERRFRLLKYGVSLVRIGVHHVPRRSLIWAVSEFAIIMTSLIVAICLRYRPLATAQEYFSESWLRLMLMTAVWQLALYYNDRYSQRASRARSAQVVRALRGMGVAILILTLLFYVLPSVGVERGNVLVTAVLSLIMMMALHLWLGVEAGLHGTSGSNRGAFSRIANTFTEIGPYVRFTPVNLARLSARRPQGKPSSASGTTPVALEPPRLKVFLCHASGDKQAVRELYDRLTTDGFLPWLDQKNLIAGQDWRNEITKAVRVSDVVVVCLSKGSVTKEGYVQKEIRLALDVEEEKPEGTIFIIPTRLEEVQVPDRLARWQWVNLYDPDGYGDLVRALNSRYSTNTQEPRSVAEPPSTNAENDLTEAMYSAYHESKKLKYNPVRFLKMLSGKGAFATAKLLLAGDFDDISEGFTKLWKLNRLDLTVEAICLRPQFRGLFSEKELSIARKRLEKVGYQSF